jgi:hypothetical protein
MISIIYFYTLIISVIILSSDRPVSNTVKVWQANKIYRLKNNFSQVLFRISKKPKYYLNIQIKNFMKSDIIHQILDHIILNL